MGSDVIIVGAGVSGLAAACALGQQGLHITVIDKSPLSIHHVNAHPLRYVAINESSRQFLESLNAWPVTTDVSPYQRMTVWDQGSTGRMEFDATELAKPFLGHIVSEKALKFALLQQIATLNCVELIGECLLDDIHIDNGVTLHSQLGVKKAKLLIAADGANSWVKKALNFSTSEKSYNHHAIIATVSTKLPHQQTAYQRFTDAGPLAFLPLQDPHQCSIVYSCHKEKYQQLLSSNDDTFKKKLAEDFDYQLGQITETSERISFPLTERHCKEYVRPHIALVADAIHTIHPLAGLGLNLGLKDIASLANYIKKNPNKIDSYQVLRAYERDRKGHNTLILNLMSAIKNTYALTGIPAMIRGFGMNLVGQSGVIRRVIIKQAMM